MKLITEVNEKINVIEEAASDGTKKLFIEGIFMQAGIPNKNRRIYPEAVLDKEVNRYIKENVETGRAYGELGHPNTPTINLDRVSHYVKSLKKEGKDWVGRAMIASTPMGDIVRNMIKDEANLGVSSRGMGTLKEIQKGLDEVQDDFRLAAAADIVADPSAPNAFVRGIMENVEWTWDEKNKVWIQEHLEETKKELNKLTVKQIQERAVSEWERFLTKLAATG